MHICRPWNARRLRRLRPAWRWGFHVVKIISGWWVYDGLCRFMIGFTTLTVGLLGLPYYELI